MTAIGLTADLAGAVLLAYDLLRPRRLVPQVLKEAEELLLGVIDALLGPPAERQRALEKSREDCAEWLHRRRTSTWRASETQLRLRKAGLLGVALLLVGFAGQLAASVIAVGASM